MRLRAAVKVGELAPGATVQLWFRVDRPDQKVGAFDNMDDRPIKTATWTHHDIVQDVDADAERVVCGMFVLGKGAAWLDDVTLEIVDANVATTGGGAVSQGSGASIPAAVRKALGNAENAPQQPFFTAWLLLPMLALLAFLMALWPGRGGDEPGAAPARQPRAVRWFAIRFTIAYWLLYCLPGPFSQLIPWLGPHLEAAHQWLDQNLVSSTARLAFGIEGELAPPNGSGDTTFNYISVLDGFVLAALVAVIWSFVGGRRFHHAVMLDLLRSYLGYVLALAMLGYGLAKVTMQYNQFPIVGDWQLQKTWGDCSPMNVVWAFMGSSRPYTIFSGLCEVLAALLLIWRRTRTLGALVAIGVMTNIVMINFCYDVPVKLYSSHLLLMAFLIAMPDIARLTNLLVRNRGTSIADATNAWSGKRLRWVRLVVKTIVIVVGFALPVGNEAIKSYEHFTEARQDPGDGPGNGPGNGEKVADKPLLVRRGFRWINEVPFNR